MFDFIKTIPKPWKHAIILGIDLALVPVSLLGAFLIQVGVELHEQALLHGFLLAVAIIPVAGLVSVRLGLPYIQFKAYEIRAVLRTGILALLTGVAAVALNNILGFRFQSEIFVTFLFVFFTLSVAARLIGLNVLLWIYKKGRTRRQV